MKPFYLLFPILAIVLRASFPTQQLFGTETASLKNERSPANYEIVQKKSIDVIGIECRTSNSPQAAPFDIPKLWETFFKDNIISKIPNRISSEVIALYCDYEGDYTKPYSLVIGCPVSSLDVIPEAMVGKTIPGGSFALFRAIGTHPQALIETWGRIWQQTRLQRAYTGDYEIYGDKFTSGSPKEVAVYVAIEN